MKKLLTFLMMSVLAIGVGWAETSTVTASKVASSSFSWTGSEGETWSGTVNGGATNQNVTNGYAQIGTSSSPSTSVTFSTNGINGTITSIVVNCAAYQGKATISTTVGGDAFGTQNQSVPRWAQVDGVNTGGEVTFEGSASGTIVITMTNGSGGRAMYIKSITVTYSEVASDVATPVISGTTPFVGSTQVSISCETSGASIYYTTDGNDPTTSSTPYSAPFTINTTATVKAIAVLNGQTSNIASKTFTAIPTIGSVEEFNDLVNNTNFKYTESNLVAIKQYETTSNSGNQNYYLYAQDGEKGMLIFGNTGQTYQPGDVIPGGFTGTRSEFNGAPEMTNPSGFTAKSQTVELTPMEITPSQVNLDNFGRYAIIKNASFNTTDKIITAGDETIAYHTTFNNSIPTDGAAYDVIGVCGYYKPNNGTAYPQFLPISFEQVEVTGADYYLIGTFNEWAQQDENYKFTARADGSYVLNRKTLPDGVRFKILKVDGSNVSWLGGSAGDYFGITKDVCTNIQLVDGADFYMEVGGNCTFTVSTDLKLTVGKEAQLFMKGSYSNDNWSTKTPLDATNTGWTITMDFDANTQFGFVDEWGYWHGGNGYLIKAEHMETDIPMVSNGNYVMENASNYTLRINSELTKLIVTDNNVVIEGDYVKVTSNDQLTSGIYLIVYEEGSLAFDGGLETLDAVGNSIEVVISDNVIPASAEVDAAAFTYDAIEKTLKSASGYYIGQNSDANGLSSSLTNAYTNTLSINANGYADIVSSGGAYLRYNSASNQTRFRYYKSESYTGQKAIQLYKKGGEIIPTLDAPEIEGETPFVGSTTVTITAEEGAAIYYTINGDTPSSESTLYEAPFQLTESATVKAIAIKDDLVSIVASKSFEKMPEIPSATAFYNYEGTSEFVFTGNLVAIAQTGNYLYAQDDAKGVLIFGSIGKEYEMGDMIPANFHAKKGAYHGAPQMTNATGMQEATEQTTIEPIELTVAQITLENYSRYVVIKNVKYEDGNYVVGNETLTIFDRFSIEFTPEEGKTYDIIGVSGWFDGPQLMPLEFKPAAVIEPVVLDGVAFTADRQWATWYGDANLALPEGVTAYVVTGVQDDAIAVEAANYIPANTGVLLNSETAAESVSAMPYTGEAGTIPTNLLVGSLEAQTVSNAYLLYNNQFILAQDNTTVGAHRCYLPMSASVQGVPILKIGQPGTVTGVETISTNNYTDNTYYNLMGQPVANPAPGIYIRGGKKVIVK